VTIPQHTFEFEGSEYLRYPEPPWKASREIPDSWFAAHIHNYLYSQICIIRDAVPYEPNEGPWASGVYFLLLDNEIIYVGKSVEILRRLNEHHEKRWRFNRYWCFGGLPELYIEHVEAFYIHAFEPSHNEKYPIPHHVIEPLIKAAKNGSLLYGHN
jgi:hypothetical protein